jgi:hypothetical protein
MLIMKYFAILLFVLLPAYAAPKLKILDQGTKLINGNLSGWESTGDGLWSVMRDGTLLGQRDPKKAENQAWLYTVKSDYREFDLHIEWWTPMWGNSGVSIRDGTRAKYAVGAAFEADKTPAHIGYEIQILNDPREKYTSGSVYLYDAAKPGHWVDNDWNTFDIESRDDMIRVKLNDYLVSQYAGDPARGKTGCIGLQLHDKTSVVMFRNMRIKEIKPKEVKPNK